MAIAATTPVDNLTSGWKFILAKQICTITENTGKNAFHQTVIRFVVDGEVPQREGSIIFPSDMIIEVYVE